MYDWITIEQIYLNRYEKIVYTELPQKTFLVVWFDQRNHSWNRAVHLIVKLINFLYKFLKVLIFSVSLRNGCGRGAHQHSEERNFLLYTINLDWHVYFQSSTPAESSPHSRYLCFQSTISRNTQCLQYRYRWAQHCSRWALDRWQELKARRYPHPSKSTVREIRTLISFTVTHFEMSSLLNSPWITRLICMKFFWIATSSLFCHKPMPIEF